MPRKKPDGFDRAVAILRGDVNITREEINSAVANVRRTPAFLVHAQANAFPDGAFMSEGVVVPFPQTGELLPAPPRFEPPPLPAIDPQPKPHRLVAWRHDGGLQTFAYNTLAVAREHASCLSPVIYWKYAIACGRDIIDRIEIPEPDGFRWNGTTMEHMG